MDKKRPEKADSLAGSFLVRSSLRICIMTLYEAREFTRPILIGLLTAGAMIAAPYAPAVAGAKAIAVHGMQVPDSPPTDDWQDAESQEPAAGETPDLTTAPPASGAMVTTTTTTTAPSQKVVEVPAAQPPAMPPALSPEPGGPVGNVAAQPPAKAGPENFPAVGGPPPASAGPGTAGGNGLAAGAATGTSASPAAPLPETAKPTGPDAYYDSATPPPPAGMEAVVGPRKVNPVVEPAMKFIIVNKDEGPQGIDSQVVAANRALKLGQYEAAASMFGTLYSRNPRDPRILMGRAVALEKTGNPELALRTYEQLLNVDHNNTNALVNMLGLLRKQYPQVALRRLMNLYDKYPGNAMIAAQIGVTEADQGQYDDAMKYLGMAASMEPNNAQHQFNMAVIADRAGKRADALKYYEQALETDAVYGESRSVNREQIYDRVSVLRQR
jgi:hypothetical protein